MAPRGAPPLLQVRLLLLLLPCACASPAGPDKNGLGRLPPMGWNTWCTGSSCRQGPGACHGADCTRADHDVCSEAMVMSVAQAMIDSGMRDAGYVYVNLDDCWENVTRNADGTMAADAARFPSGTLAPLAAWLHARGFKFGMYTSAGDKTCSTGGRAVPGDPGARGVPGSCALGDQKSGANCAPYYARDARTFASWGVDYVKLDWCLGKDKPPGGSHEELTAAFHAALNQTGRPMWLNFHCDDVYADWCAAHGNSWRATHDHHDVWENTASTIEGMAEGARTSGPYRWADPDFLMTGGAGCDAGIMRAGERCPGQTEAEYRTEFALWSLWSAPLLVASDLRNMTAFQRSVLLNRELIAVNQDALGASYGRVGGWHCKEGPAACQLWAKPLAGGGAAVGLFNAGSDPHRITFNLTLLPEFAAAGRARARDLWAGRDAGVVAGAVTAEVAPHDTAVFRLSPA